MRRREDSSVFRTWDCRDFLIQSTMVFEHQGTKHGATCWELIRNRTGSLLHSVWRRRGTAGAMEDNRSRDRRHPGPERGRED